MGGQGLSIKRSLFSKTKLCDILGNLHRLNETAPKKKEEEESMWHAKAVNLLSSAVQSVSFTK